MIKQKMIRGPHLLFTGANGAKCYGVTLQSGHPLEWCRKQGYQYTWDANAFTIAQWGVEELMAHVAMTEEEAAEVVAEVARLTAAQE